ncbi:MAG: hypothetical protein MUD12_00485 [Spirochaetes bacterium]|jgi:hypothetical protein|nr:hypothetical protein [Spirochaetota bacterium]
MTRKKISIITGWGDGLGNGHLQRMANLASYLNSRGFHASIVSENRPELFPGDALQFFSGKILPGTDLIIRDMRDSETGEIESLKKYAPVLAVDDSGPGRKSADFNLTLLPNPPGSGMGQPSYNMFIYGYNITREIKMMGKEKIHKSMDVSFYLPHDIIENPDSILKILPDGMNVAIISHRGHVILKNGSTMPLNKNHAEILLSSRLLICHFGITLFEGHLSGCRLATINPTGYHSSLSDAVKPELGLENLGIYPGIKPDSKKIISGLVASSISESADPSKINDRIQENLDRLHGFLLNDCLN